MTRVSVEEIMALYEARKKINDLEISEIEWTENGEPLVIDPEILKEFRFTGLSNMDFILGGFHLGPQGLSDDKSTTG